MVSSIDPFLWDFGVYLLCILNVVMTQWTYKRPLGPALRLSACGKLLLNMPLTTFFLPYLTYTFTQHGRGLVFWNCRVIIRKLLFLISLVAKNSLLIDLA